MLNSKNLILVAVAGVLSLSQTALAKDYTEGGSYYEPDPNIPVVDGPYAGTRPEARPGYDNQTPYDNQDDHYNEDRNDRRPDRYDDPYNHGSGYQTETLSAWVGSPISNFRLSLNHMLRIGPQFQGWRVKRVMVEIGQAYHNTQFHLLADGALAAHSFSSGNLIYLQPQLPLVFGRNLRALDLGIVGSAFVHRVTLELERSGGGHGDPTYPGRDILIDAHTYERLEGRNQHLQLARILNVRRNYFDYDVQRVVVRMRSDYGHGEATLSVNGHPVSTTQVVSGGTREYEFSIVGRHLTGDVVQGLQLKTSGRITVEYVGLYLTEKRGNRRHVGRR